MNVWNAHIYIYIPTTIDVPLTEHFFAEQSSRKTQKKITKRDQEQLPTCHSMLRIRNNIAEKRENALEAIDDVDKIIQF